MAVGAIEEILMDGEFASIQNDFCERNCGMYPVGAFNLISLHFLNHSLPIHHHPSHDSDIFTNDEENKLEYTPIFQQYTELIGMLSFF